MNKKGILVVVSGFAGSGKGTVMKELLSRYDNYSLSVSATTRAPRPGEVNGKEYFFKSRDEFEEMINKAVLEYFEVSPSNTFDDRTIFLDLSGLSRTKENNVAIPPSEYTSLLMQEAKSKLGEYRVTENIEIESKEFYNLGEIKTFKGGGIVAKQMVTDVIFAYEDGRIKKTCSFGYQRLNRTAKLERRFKK